MTLQRKMLQDCGVRVTLLRIKVLQAMQAACEGGVALSLAALQNRLHATGNPVSLGALRQVVYRLEAVDLLRRGMGGLWSCKGVGWPGPTRGHQELVMHHDDTALPDRLGDMPAGVPAGVVPYRRTAEFTHETIPAALRRDHATKAGVWAWIRVQEGRLRYRVESWGTDVVLTPERPGVVAPEVLHSVEPLGEVRFFVEFCALPEG